MGAPQWQAGIHQGRAAAGALTTCSRWAESFWHFTVSELCSVTVPFDFFLVWLMDHYVPYFHAQAGSACAQSSIRRGFAQRRVTLSRRAVCLRESNPASLPVGKQSRLCHFLHRHGVIDEETPTHSGCSQRRRMCRTLQSHLMHRMHHPLIKGHCSHMKTLPTLLEICQGLQGFRNLFRNPFLHRYQSQVYTHIWIVP